LIIVAYRDTVFQFSSIFCTLMPVLACLTYVILRKDRVGKEGESVLSLGRCCGYSYRSWFLCACSGLLWWLWY